MVFKSFTDFCVWLCVSHSLTTHRSSSARRHTDESHNKRRSFRLHPTPIPPFLGCHISPKLDCINAFDGIFKDWGPTVDHSFGPSRRLSHFHRPALTCFRYVTLVSQHFFWFLQCLLLWRILRFWLSDTNMESESYVLTVDIGTTTIRSVLYDSNCEERGSYQEKVPNSLKLIDQQLEWFLSGQHYLFYGKWWRSACGNWAGAPIQPVCARYRESL